MGNVITLWEQCQCANFALTDHFEQIWFRCLGLALDIY